MNAILLVDITPGRIYSLKITKDDILIRDYVPVMRIKDKTIGLYDKVTKTLYTNSGSGAFTYGSKVGYL